MGSNIVVGLVLDFISKFDDLLITKYDQLTILSINVSRVYMILKMRKIDIGVWKQGLMRII